MLVYKQDVVLKLCLAGPGREANHCHIDCKAWPDEDLTGPDRRAGGLKTVCAAIGRETEAPSNSNRR